MKDINKTKLELWQQDSKKIIDSYRNALHQHFNLVKFKSKSLIDSRWT